MTAVTIVSSYGITTMYVAYNVILSFRLWFFCYSPIFLLCTGTPRQNGRLKKNSTLFFGGGRAFPPKKNKNKNQKKDTLVTAVRKNQTVPDRSFCIENNSCSTNSRQKRQLGLCSLLCCLTSFSHLRSRTRISLQVECLPFLAIWRSCIVRRGERSATTQQTHAKCKSQSRSQSSCVRHPFL